jgi:hypothetical protein
MSNTGRQELIATLENTKAEVEALVAEAGDARLTASGVTGEWSIKDMLAHMTAWEERVVAWAEGIHQGRKPAPPPWSTDWNDDQVNALIYERDRGRSLPDVLEGWRRTHRKVVDAVRTMSEEELFHEKIEWLGDVPFAEALAGNSYEHQQEHAAQIRAWLAAQEEAAG